MASDTKAHCAQCRHRGVPHAKQPAYRQCLRIARVLSTGEGITMDPDDLAFTHDSAGAFSAIYTEDQFGCILFEAND